MCNMDLAQKIITKSVEKNSEQNKTNLSNKKVALDKAPQMNPPLS